MKDNKIIYTGSFRFPNGDAASQRVLNNAKILRSNGYNVIFISFGGTPVDTEKNKDGYFYHQGFRYINTADIDVKQNNIIKRIKRFICSGRNALNVIRGIISDVECVIAYQPSLYFTKQIKFLCKLHKKKFITDLTEWYAPYEFPGGIFAPPAWLNEWNMCITQKMVTNKIVISSFLDKYYQSSNNLILPPLVDSKEKKWQIFKDVLPPFNGVRLIYAGTPGKKDSIGTMLDAVIACIKEGQKLQFVLVGVTTSDLSKYTNHDLSLLSDNLIVCGKIPQSDVPSYYHASDFSIIIRKKTRKNMAGFPTKLAETMMSGCPVILNYTSDIIQFVQDGNNGFVVTDSSFNQLKKVLCKIAILPREEIIQMKFNSLKCGIKNFDYSQYIDNMEVFMNKIK